MGASTAYYEVLDYDPENTDALDALERLFVTLEDWEQLCDVLRQRVEVVEDDFEKTRLWRKIGEVQRDKAENLHAAIEYYRATLNPAEHTTADYQAEEAAIDGTPTQPHLYLHGESDGCIGVEVGRLAEPLLTVPGSRLEVIEGAWHFLQLEQPGRVNRSILEFLASR